MNNDYEYQILKLTPQFYTAYPNCNYPEILAKDARPYSCLLLQSRYGYFICIPFRSHIHHNYAFKFHTSARSRRDQSGLDYSKMIIVDGKDTKNYLDTSTALVDNDEYIEMRNNISTIIQDSQTYIDEYVSYIQKAENCIDERNFKRKYQLSTLPYFHNLLGLGCS